MSTFVSCFYSGGLDQPGSGYGGCGYDTAMIIQAAAGFQKSQVGADVARSIRETNISRDQQVGTTVASATKDKVMVAWESHAAKNDLWGR